MTNLSYCNWIKFLNITNLISALFIVSISIFHYEKIHNITLYIFATTFVLGYLFEKRWKAFAWTKYSYFFLMFIIYYLLTIVWMPFEERQDYSMKMLEYRLVFLGIGIVGILGLNKYHKFKYYVWVLGSTSLLASLYILGKTIFITGFSAEFLRYMSSVRSEINYHMAFNYYLNISNVLVIYVLLKNEKRKPITYFYIISLLINYVVLLTSDGRIGFLTSIIILIMPLIALSLKQKKLAIVLSVLFLSTCSFIFFQKDRVNNISIPDDPRTFIWKNSIELIKESAMGYGTGDAIVHFSNKVTSDSLFVEKCGNDPIFIVIERNRIVCIHSHNLFLQSMLEFGVIGLIVSLMLYLIPFMISFSVQFKERLAIIFVILTTFLQTLTDYISAVPIIIYLLVMIVLFNHAEKEKLLSKNPLK